MIIVIIDYYWLLLTRLADGLVINACVCVYVGGWGGGKRYKDEIKETEKGRLRLVTSG